MESVINVENFYFAYKKSDLVLRDINFEIKKGSFTVITGPSGAGKSTLFALLNGTLHEDGGDFFMRVAFDPGPADPEALRAGFTDIAGEYGMRWNLRSRAKPRRGRAFWAVRMPTSTA